MDATKIYSKTYDRTARAKDEGRPGPSPDLAAQRAVQDAAMSERHRCFDLAARDNTPKYCRHHFAVVGEGSKSSQEKYRARYAEIDWSR